MCASVKIERDEALIWNSGFIKEKTQFISTEMGGA